MNTKTVTPKTPSSKAIVLKPPGLNPKANASKNTNTKGADNKGRPKWTNVKPESQNDFVMRITDFLMLLLRKLLEQQDDPEEDKLKRKQKIDITIHKITVPVDAWVFHHMNGPRPMFEDKMKKEFFQEWDKGTFNSKDNPEQSQEGQNNNQQSQEGQNNNQQSQPDANNENVAPDHYQTLGVDRNASPKEIKQAYRKEALQNHPDKGGSTEKMQQINKANEVLKNPASRASYDAANPKAGLSPRPTPGNSSSKNETSNRDSTPHSMSPN